jgi:serine/threonine-protein kinase
MTQIPLLNNRYQLERPLGSGGMAVVYRAHDHMLERAVAIKVLREDYSRDPAFRERFRQEARAAANLSHPNIVTVHDFGIDQGRLFIVMEYVPGTNLNAMLQNRGRFTLEEAIPLMTQACAGVGYAHRAGLVHCDIKPHNFLITPDNRLKVTDFGIARALASIHPDEQADIVWGSPQYFSPEQATGAAPSPASDVYSLGVVMYFLLTGRLPFTASSSSELAQLHRSAPPVPPRHFNPTLPPPLEEIILKVLSKEPSQRYRTADQLGRVLISFSSAKTRPAESQHGPEQAEKPAPATGRPDLQQTIPPGPISIPPAPASTPPGRPRPRAISPTPTSTQPTRPVEAAAPRKASRTTITEQDTPEITAPNPIDLDWTTVALGLLTVLAVGGLIPLWVWVYFAYNPPAP